MLGIVVAFSLSACGIKAPPKPPAPPQVLVKRIGNYIYIKPVGNEKLKVKGFSYENGIFFKKDKSSACFEIKVAESSSLYCVPPAIEKRPIVLKAYRKFRIHLELSGFKRFRLYKHIPGKPFNPFQESVVVGKKAVLPPDFSAFCYAITGLENGIESLPEEVCFRQQKPPTPKTPQNVNFMVYKDKIYIYWEPNEDSGYTIGYLVYKNGKLLTKKPIHSNVFVDKLPKGFTVYDIQAVGEYNTKSKPAELQITLKALKQALGL
jgi:hypothetical protein